MRAAEMRGMNKLILSFLWILALFIKFEHAQGQVPTAVPTRSPTKS